MALWFHCLSCLPPGALLAQEHRARDSHPCLHPLPLSIRQSRGAQVQPVTNPPHPHPRPHASHHPLLRSMGWGPGLLPDPAGLAPPSLPAAHLRGGRAPCGVSHPQGSVLGVSLQAPLSLRMSRAPGPHPRLPLPAVQLAPALAPREVSSRPFRSPLTQGFGLGPFHAAVFPPPEPVTWGPRGRGHRMAPQKPQPGRGQPACRLGPIPPSRFRRLSWLGGTPKIL